MADCTDSEAADWRDVATRELVHKYDILTPMIRDFRVTSTKNKEAFIVESDKMDVLKADVVLANCWKPSVGTSMEIMFAHEQHREVILIVPEHFSISPWYAYHASKIFRTLEEALNYLREK